MNSVILDGIRPFAYVYDYIHNYIGTGSQFKAEISKVHAFAFSLAKAGLLVWIWWRVVKVFLGDGASRLFHDFTLVISIYIILVATETGIEWINKLPNIQKELLTYISSSPTAQNPADFADSIANTYLEGAVSIHNTYTETIPEDGLTGGIEKAILSALFWVPLAAFVVPGCLLSLIIYIALVVNEFLMILLMVFAPVALAGFIFPATRQIGMSWVNMVIAVLIKVLLYSVVISVLDKVTNALIKNTVTALFNSATNGESAFLVVSSAILTSWIIFTLFNKFISLVNTISGALANATVVSSLVKDSGGNAGQVISAGLSQSIGKITGRTITGGASYAGQSAAGAAPTVGKAVGKSFKYLNNKVRGME